MKSKIFSTVAFTIGLTLTPLLWWLGGYSFPHHRGADLVMLVTSTPIAAIGFKLVMELAFWDWWWNNKNK